jgi:hypothetical protein
MVRLILRRRSKAGFHQIDLTNKAAVQVVVDFPRESQAIILVPLGAERYNHETPLDVGGPLHACRFVSSRLFMVEPSAIPVNDAGGRFASICASLSGARSRAFSTPRIAASAAALRAFASWSEGVGFG